MIAPASRPPIFLISAISDLIISPYSSQNGSSAILSYTICPHSSSSEIYFLSALDINAIAWLLKVTAAEFVSVAISIMSSGLYLDA